jgi:hypothetical protein
MPGTISRMAEVFSPRSAWCLATGFSVDWVPGTGTTVLVNGKPEVGPYNDREFFNACCASGSARTPADCQLKDALLGVPKAAPVN